MNYCIYFMYILFFLLIILICLECWNYEPDNRPTINQVVAKLEASLTKQQMTRQFKLNHGLFLDGYSIKPSKQAVYSEGGELNISLYRGQPLIYTFINDRNSHTNLLNFISDRSSHTSFS